MNEVKVQALLKQWEIILEIGEQAAKTTAEKSTNGLLGRIKRTTGQPVVFDLTSYEKQKIIQNDLCKELPRWADVIRSKPEIMDGYSWTRKDFIELYFDHFQLVIEKLKRVVEKTSAV